jgi:CO/xanthine dehydrogenase Mo-binding subunit
LDISLTNFVRQDAHEKVTGHGQYTADLAMTGLLHARFRWSDHPHARITRIDTSAAEALPGVRAVVTQDDVPDVRYGAFVKDRTLFARDVVRYEGEVIAAVAATSEEIADRAVALIEVEYEVLDPVLDPEAALRDSSPLVHPDWASYEYDDKVHRDGNRCAFARRVKGDADAGMAEADIVVSETYRADMSHPVPIEPHAIVARWHGGKLTIWSSSQVPFLAREGVAETLQVPEHHVRVIVPNLGGGFGGKCDVHYEPHVAALARKAGRPVRLVFSRREEFVAPDKVRHAMVIELETGLKSDGTITARRGRLVLDGGAYVADSPGITEIAAMMVPGPYRIPHLHVDAYTAYTNRTPAGSTRAPAGPQVCWAVEQHTDALAERVGLDPYEFRMRNLVEGGDEGPTRQVLEGVGMKDALREAAALAGWGEELPDGEAIGIACGWWFSMASPSGAYLKLNGDGTGTITTGAQENGSGAVMGLAVLAADALGMRPEEFRLVAQDTDVGPWDMGSAGSQTTFNNGRAVLEAAEQVREQLLDLASEELEVSPEDLELAGGSVSVRGTSHGVPIRVLANRAQSSGGKLLLGRGSGTPIALPEHDKRGCVSDIMFSAFAAPTFFAHVVRARVDKETGVVHVLRVGAGHDFGRVINPLGAEGQVEGGVVHGIGMALTEGTQYDGGRQRNPHLLDYKLQTAADAPEIRIAFVGEPARNGGPLGIKGVGEPPVVPTAGAVGNAIAQVIRARVRQLPMTPERVWGAAQEASS